MSHEKHEEVITCEDLDSFPCEKAEQHFFSMQNIDKENPIYLNVGHKTSEQSAQILHTYQNREYGDNEHNWCM